MEEADSVTGGNLSSYSFELYHIGLLRMQGLNLCNPKPTTACLPACPAARCKFQTGVCNGQGLSAHARHVGAGCSHHNTHRIPCYSPLLHRLQPVSISSLTQAVTAMHAWRHWKRTVKKNKKKRRLLSTQNRSIFTRCIIKGVRVNTSSRYTPVGPAAS